MLISMEWLNDFLDLSEWTPKEIADQLSLTGLEVDGELNIGQSLSNLVVGYVKECVPHEDSDRLSVCQVDVGDKIYQIVCGAPNVKADIKVIVALPGAVLPGDFKIEPTVLRGVESNGMICSLQELGFKENVIPKNAADGIFILPKDAPVGESVVSYMKLDDWIFELDLTPNRADALSMYGVAYEVGAIIHQTPQFKSHLDEALEAIHSQMTDFTLDVDEELSPNYQARLIQDVKVEESPVWLQMRLMKSGIRPINNIVDLTNYCMLLYGQPTHAFDFDKLPGNNLGVRYAKEGETLTTLDGKEQTLNTTDIVITSNDQPVALGGVMGGLETEVTDETTNVLLEAAVFNPLNVRETSKRLNLRSESSSRFEKGINAALVDEAGDNLAAMIANLAGGKVDPTIQKATTPAPEPVTVTVAYEDIPHKLGIDVTRSELETIFDRLNFEVEYGEKYFTVIVPPRRWDISIKADVLEEIARIYGYDNIPTTLPVVAATPGQLSRRQHLTREVRRICESVGLNQVISYGLTSKKRAQLLADRNQPTVELLLPLSEERAVLRQSMFPAFVEIAQYNIARRAKSLAFYELGQVFFSRGENTLPVEETRLALLVSGTKQLNEWNQAKENYDFFDLKGIIETLFENLTLASNLDFEATNRFTELHPGRSANILLDGEVIGIMGQLHPTLASDYDLPEETFFAELNMEKIYHFETEMVVQQTIPRYPATTRDLALLVPQEVTHQQLVETIEKAGGDHLIQVDLFDLYEGEGIQEGMKSLAYHLTFQDPNKTLKDKEIDQAMEEIQQALQTIDSLEIR